MIQWEGEGSQTGVSQAVSSSTENRILEEEGSKQIVTFQDCVFRGNFIDDSASFPGIIENTFNSDLVVKNCLFENNVYGDTDNPATVGYAIRSFGPLTLESSCFIDNIFLNHGPVLVYGAQYSAFNNYVQSSQTDLACGFGALFSSKDDMAETTPVCEQSDANTCAFSQAPTVSPTAVSIQSPEVIDREEEQGGKKLQVKSGSSLSTSRISTVATSLLSVLALCLSASNLF